MTIIITGCSRGIGAGLADVYSARGEEVIGTTRDGDWPLDVTDPAAHQRFADQLGDRAVDLLICNAGVYLDKGHALADGFGATLWADTFAANVTGVFLTIQSLLPHLKRAQAPKIAIISSQMGSSERAGGGSYIYRASKAAALNLGRNLALDLAPQGIAVGIYHPGWVRTDMGSSAADISVEQSANGLAGRFDALGVSTTGTFESWDGQSLPY